MEAAASSEMLVTINLQYFQTKWKVAEVFLKIIHTLFNRAS
jgi:hypothetical protein